MAARDWSIEGRYVEFCNCALRYPCESMAEPSKGHCTGAVAFQVDEGHSEGVSLDGMKVVATFSPRAIHHGNGHMQPILEDTLSEEKEAIFYIMGGEDQPVGTCSRSSASSSSTFMTRSLPRSISTGISRTARPASRCRIFCVSAPSLFATR